MNEFWNWWQHLPAGISPVIFQIGSFKLQWYGLMYIVAFAITYVLVRYRVAREDRFDLSVEQVNDLTTYAILGLVIGARLGYVIFYNLSYYLKHPLEIVLPFDFSNGITFTGISGTGTASSSSEARRHSTLATCTQIASAGCPACRWSPASGRARVPASQFCCGSDATYPASSTQSPSARSALAGD